MGQNPTPVCPCHSDLSGQQSTVPRELDDPRGPGWQAFAASRSPPGGHGTTQRWVSLSTPRQLRLLAGLTPRELATRLGVSVDDVRILEATSSGRGTLRRSLGRLS